MTDIVDCDVETLRVDLPLQVAFREVGDDVTVAVRANSVRVAPGSANGSPNELTCTVIATEYLGDTIKVHMRAAEHPLMAKLPEQRYPELASLKDKPVVASWDATNVQLLRD